MRFKTWPVAALGLVGLLSLIVVSILASASNAQEIYAKLDQLNTYYRGVDANLQRLRSEVNRAEIAGRDYLLDLERGLLDTEPARAQDYRLRLAALRENNAATLAELRRLARRDPDKVARLQSRLDDYWRTFDPIMEQPPAAIRQGQNRFLRRDMVPRRDAILAIAKEIEEFNDASLAAQREAVARREATLRDSSRKLLWQSLLLGAVVAIVAVFRLRMLERRSEQQRKKSEEAEGQMRQLSQQLVAAQEEERKSLSRELHDHVAQVLTALRMELGRIERTRTPADTRIGAAVTESKRLVDDMFRTVRDLTLGLRPTMLDDLGLQPALEWQVRDLTDRYNVKVDLQTEGDLEVLPDQYRTCIFRAVQEALTNCVRHARAQAIKVCVTRRPETLDVSVSDDGIGLDPSRCHNGLGLRGIEERVKELHGTMAIHSAEPGGTRLTFHLPLPADSVADGRLARIAG